MAAESSALRPEQYVAGQVRVARESKGWKQAELADRLTELGFKGWGQSKVAKIENGQIDRLALRDVLALAVALEVQPVHLLAGEADVEIAPRVKRTAAEFREWVRGYHVLGPGQERSYYLGGVVPDDEVERGMLSFLALTGDRERLYEKLDEMLRRAGIEPRRPQMPEQSGGSAAGTDVKKPASRSARRKASA